MTRADVSNPFPFVPYDRAKPPLDTQDIATIARYWTAIDEDLHTVEPERAQIIRNNRISVAQFDYPRTAHWQDPDSVDVFSDIPYLPDGGYGDDEIRGHLLDLYLPHHAIETGGSNLPVVIDIHGGGFTYGYKELNRNFCTHLAARGFAVFSLNYRPAPQTHLLGQLSDIQAALRWIRAHIQDWPISDHNIAITGDSAGAALAWFTTLIECDEQAARVFHIPTPSGLPIMASVLVSGVYDLAMDAPSLLGDRSWRSLKHVLGEEFFDDLEHAQEYLNPLSAVRAVHNIPPTLLTTSTDDFIQAETLQLATAFAAAGTVDFALDDVAVGPTTTLGHVYPICMTWLPESERMLNLMHDFVYAHCR